MPDTRQNADLIPITLEDLAAASEEFRLTEKRGIFYDMALGLVRAGYEIEGCILVLATWNFASFRYVTDYDIEGFKNLVSCELRDDFAALADWNIQTIDLTAHGSRIENMFNRLASMKEVLYTGATKVMHLKCPELFVIWDDYIRGGKPLRLYAKLGCISSGKWRCKKYKKTGSGYVSFLTDIQDRFRALQYPSGTKTLAKAIDEYHYVNVTLPIQDREALEEAKMEVAKAAAARVAK